MLIVYVLTINFMLGILRRENL